MIRELAERLKRHFYRIGRFRATSNSVGTCDSCGLTFSYQLIHNGFNDSAFAYCDRCGCEASLSCWYERIPAGAQLKLHGPVNPEAEALLLPCTCGGTFRANASPRCPHCGSALSAELARSYIEADAPGTAKGWRWQGSWAGMYSIIVEGRWVKDNWRQV
jgi:uncharacterized paraquat-inducible protein A